MKHSSFQKLMLVGMATGLVLNGQLKAQQTGASTAPTTGTQYRVEDFDYHLMSEDELKAELNDEGLKVYNSLDDEGKALARQVASQICSGTNTCKGLNACKTENNDCAGQGACKGQSKCLHTDKNAAVKLVADKMAKKRADLVK